MIKYFVKAFKITNENIILATPLVLFLFLLSIYLDIAKRVPETIPAMLLLFITIMFMLSAFFAGWFFMVKKAINLDKREFKEGEEEDKAKASFNLIKEVPPGIGEYFLPFVGCAFLYLGLIILLSFTTYAIGINLIGKVGINLLDLKMALNTPATMKTLISSLTHEQLLKLNAWYFLTLVNMAIFSFITMFWGTEIVIRTKNSFLAFFRALKFTFKNFLSAIILFIYISIVNFISSLINAVSAINPILYFISMIIYFYFVVYVVVLVFLYYDSEINSKLKEQTENNCNSGSDSVGENQICDSDRPEE